MNLVIDLNKWTIAPIVSSPLYRKSRITQGFWTTSHRCNIDSSRPLKGLPHKLVKESQRKPNKSWKTRERAIKKRQIERFATKDARRTTETATIITVAIIDWNSLFLSLSLPVERHAPNSCKKAGENRDKKKNLFLLNRLSDTFSSDNNNNNQAYRLA